MSDKTDELRDIFLSVSEEGTVTERQREDPSRAPVEADGDLAAEVASAAREDGLEDALDGDAADASLATG